MHKAHQNEELKNTER